MNKFNTHVFSGNMQTNIKIRDAGIIIIFSLVSLILLIANPGYYNHDELQRLDHVSQYGFADYVKSYVVIKRGDAFSTPVRPYAFFIQGILSFAMKDYPVAVHLLDVVTHATVAILLYLLIHRYSSDRQLSLLSALIFVINPMAMIATGWSAALMDRWYVLFGLLSLLEANKYVMDNLPVRHVVLVFFWASLSVLSKETSLILPGAMILILLYQPSYAKNIKFWQALAAWLLPVISLFIYRFPALVSSFGNPQVTSYTASFINIPENIFIYFSYPFIFTLTEAINWVFVPRIFTFFAFALHLSLVFFLWHSFDKNRAIFYLYFYFLFLIPVLFIPSKGAHYLYGSSLVFSTALGCLLTRNRSRLYPGKLFANVAILIITIHSIYIQLFVYHIGTCINRAMTSTNSSYIGLDHPASLDFRGEPGAPIHILHRFLTGRNQIGENYPIKFSISDWGSEKIPGSVTFIMDKNCYVYPEKITPQ